MVLTVECNRLSRNCCTAELVAELEQLPENSCVKQSSIYFEGALQLGIYFPFINKSGQVKIRKED